MQQEEGVLLERKRAAAVNEKEQCAELKNKPLPLHKDGRTLWNVAKRAGMSLAS